MNLGVWGQLINDSRLILSGGVLQEIQDATFRYSWRGVAMVKNPFDLAIYPLLIWDVKPRTLIEIGSHRGGSALWFADIMDMFGLDPESRVHSVDIRPPIQVSHARVEFHEGNSRNPLEASVLESSPHPWIVIDDSEHSYESCAAVLAFFHQWLEVGDYFVMEDGIIDALGESERYKGGPNRAVSGFLEEHGDQYEIDRKYCDFFGSNMTFNPDGYIRRSA